MTKILRAHKLLIVDAMENMIRNVKAEAHMPLDTFLNLFFTAKQRELMDTVAGFVDMRRYNPHSITLENVCATIPDSIPVPENCTRSSRVRVSVTTSYKGFSPLEWEFQPNAAPEDIDEFNRCVDEVTLQGSIRAMWRNVKDYYEDHAASHEEMRYLFPGTVSILRKAGLHDIAATVENVRCRPPTHLPRHMVNVFRYMNQWFGVQMMLGTFEVRPYTRDSNTVTITLSSCRIRDGYRVLDN